LWRPSSIRRSARLRTRPPGTRMRWPGFRARAVQLTPDAGSGAGWCEGRYSAPHAMRIGGAAGPAFGAAVLALIGSCRPVMKPVPPSGSSPAFLPLRRFDFGASRTTLKRGRIAASPRITISTATALTRSPASATGPPRIGQQRPGVRAAGCCQAVAVGPS
jgi:hypothetical protein